MKGIRRHLSYLINPINIVPEFPNIFNPLNSFHCHLRVSGVYTIHLPEFIFHKQEIKERASAIKAAAILLFFQVFFFSRLIEPKGNN